MERSESDLAISTPKRERLNRRVTTSVTGLVEIFVAAPPNYSAPPLEKPTPPIRTYTEVTVPSCLGRSRTALLELNDIEELRGQLTQRLDNATAVYNDPTVRSDLGSRFDLAAYTKAQCGIAIGFTKKYSGSKVYI